MKLRSLVFAVASLFLAAAASATTTNLIVNGDFETSNVGFGSYAYANGFSALVVSAPSWSFVDGTGVANHAGPWGGEATTSSVAFLQNYSGFSPNSPTVSQTFSSSDAAFAISFDLAQRPGNSESVAVTLDGNAVGTTLTPPGAAWSSYTFNVSGLTGAVHTLAFQGINGTGAGDSSLFLDNVSVSAVPEPETYGMLFAGLGLIGFMARRRSANRAA